MLSHFCYFLWISVPAFGMISLTSEAGAEEKLYSAKGKRDPFVQLVGSSSKASTGGLLGVESVEEILVEGIVQDADPKNSIVIANGSVLKEGEEIGNVKLLKIDRDGALFSVNGVEGRRELYQEKSEKGLSDKNS